jgi:hypothetical protein
MPQLRDAFGKLTIGPARGARGQELVTAGATSIVFNPDGSRAGVYVDNETPDRDQVARKLAGMEPGKLIVVGLYPSEPGHTIPGCLCALEWYPYHQAWGPPPPAPAYILQRDFAWPGDTPPTAVEFCQLLANARSHNPRLVWTY